MRCAWGWAAGSVVWLLPLVVSAQAAPWWAPAGEPSDLGRQLDEPVATPEASRQQLAPAYPSRAWQRQIDERDGRESRPRARRADARYADALAGSWAGAAGGSVLGLVLGAVIGSVFCTTGDSLACAAGVLGGATLFAANGYAMGTVAGVTLGIGGRAWHGFAAVGLSILVGGLEALAFAGLFAATGEVAFFAVGIALPIASIPFVAPLLAVALFDEAPSSEEARVSPYVAPTEGGASAGVVGAF